MAVWNGQGKQRTDKLNDCEEIPWGIGGCGMQKCNASLNVVHVIGDFVGWDGLIETLF